MTRIAAFALTTLVVAGTTSSPAPTTTPGPTTAASSASPSTSPASPSGSAAQVVDVDEHLLDLLPAAVGGIAIVSDPDTAASIASDADLATNASAIAVGIALAPGASGADDLAVASVVELRPGIYNDAFFRDWRDSYDTAACESAGGVSGNAESDVAGHHVFIGTCAGGAHTYHVYLERDDAIVSVTSVGELRLGEQIIAGLRT